MGSTPQPTWGSSWHTATQLFSSAHPFAPQHPGCPCCCPCCCLQAADGEGEDEGEAEGLHWFIDVFEGGRVMDSTQFHVFVQGLGLPAERFNPPQVRRCRWCCVWVQAWAGCGWARVCCLWWVQGVLAAMTAWSQATLQLHPWLLCALCRCFRAAVLPAAWQRPPC